MPDFETIAWTLQEIVDNPECYWYDTEAKAIRISYASGGYYSARQTECLLDQIGFNAAILEMENGDYVVVVDELHLLDEEEN